MTYDMTVIPLQARNSAFLSVTENVDDAIQIRSNFKNSMWRSMIPRGAYTLESGLEKKSYRFLPGMGPQRGLHQWRPIQVSRPASGGRQAYDACTYNPYTVSYGFDAITYSGYEISYVTPPICIKDLRFEWQIRQQLNAVYSFLGDVTNDLWENYAREEYMYFANAYGHGYVMTAGSPTGVTFSYDPYSVDADGDNILTIANGVTNAISTLQWKPMKWFNRLWQMQYGRAAIGNQNGRPLFGLAMDLEEFDAMIERDSNLREDYHYAAPDVLIDNYGTVTNFKGNALMHDLFTPRFAIKSNTTAAITMKRIDPFVEATDGVTLGQRIDVNPDYLNAEYELVLPYFKNVYKIEIPPAGPTSPGGGTSFGATPGLNGEWKWLNIQDAKSNPLNEMGYYFMRAEAFAAPMESREAATMLLIKRCVGITVGKCGLGGGDVETVGTVSTAGGTAVGDMVSVTLDVLLDADVGDRVTLSAGSTGTVIIADASAAPTYVLSTSGAFTVGSIVSGVTVTVV